MRYSLARWIFLFVDPSAHWRGRYEAFARDKELKISLGLEKEKSKDAREQKQTAVALTKLVKGGGFHDQNTQRKL